MAIGDVIIKILGDDTDLSNKLKGVGGKASVAMKAVAAGTAAAGAAVAALGKSAMDAYASFEQLDGGIKTLFGDAAAKTVADNAAKAFATAGMSANAYMETVTSVSASLMQSLGGDAEAAARAADDAINAMADNASKMGTSMDTIVQTYQSLARGNYAMLDNLKLGYGGTKAELERLLADAEAYKASMGESVDFDINNFADVAAAIDAIQEKMGLAGSAAEEASTTIEGSVNSMKAAWQNMLVGIADENADFDTLLGNLISSAGTAAENILPRVKVILEGIGKLAVELAPTLATTATDMLVSFGQYLVDNAPSMLARVPELIAGLAGTIGANAPKLVTVAGQLILALGAGLVQMIPSLVENAPTIVGAVADGIEGMVDNMVQAGINLIDGLAEGLVNAVPNLLKAAGDVGTSLLNKVKSIFKIQSPSKVMRDEVGAMLVAGVAEGIDDNASIAVNAVKSLGDDILRKAESISDFTGLFTGVETKDVSGKDLINNLENQMEAIEKYRDNLEALKEKGVSGSLFEELAGMGPDAADEIEALNKLTAKQLDNYISLYEEKKAAAEEIAKGFFSVGEEAAEALQETSAEGAAEGVEKQENAVTESTRLLVEAAKEEVSVFRTDFETIGADLMAGLGEGIEDGESGVVSAIKTVLRAAVKKAKEEMDINSPSRVMAMIGDYMAQGVGMGWKNRMAEVNASISHSLSDGLESRMTNAYARMKAAMDNGMQKLSGDLAIQAKGASNYTTNYNTTREGDFIVQIEKIVNDGKGTVESVLQEAEFIRKQRAIATGGA